RRARPARGPRAPLRRRCARVGLLRRRGEGGGGDGRHPAPRAVLNPGGQPSAGEPSKATGSPGFGSWGGGQDIIFARLSVTSRHSSGFQPSALPMIVVSVPMWTSAGILVTPRPETTLRSGSQI